MTTPTPSVPSWPLAVVRSRRHRHVTLLEGTSPVSGKTVELSSSSTNAVITPGSEITGADGLATFTVSDPTAETVTFSAVDTSDALALRRRLR